MTLDDGTLKLPLRNLAEEREAVQFDDEPPSAEELARLSSGTEEAIVLHRGESYYRFALLGRFKRFLGDLEFFERAVTEFLEQKRGLKVFSLDLEPVDGGLGVSYELEGDEEGPLLGYADWLSFDQLFPMKGDQDAEG